MNDGSNVSHSVRDASRQRVVVITNRNNKFQQDAVWFPDRAAALDWCDTLTNSFTKKYEVAIIEVSTFDEAEDLYKEDL